MKRALVTAFFLASASAAPALAQDESTLELNAPSISETEQAEPDWYRQYTFSSSSTEQPVWQVQPSEEMRLAWVEGDRWQLSVDLTKRPDGSPLAREEMSAGAEFRITPRLSVGGSVSLGAQGEEDSADWDDQTLEAGIRLRSAFKF